MLGKYLVVQAPQKLDKFIIMKRAVPILTEEVFEKAPILDGTANFEANSQAVPVGGPLSIMRTHQCHHFLELFLFYLPRKCYEDQ